MIVINSIFSGKINSFVVKYCKILEFNDIEYVITDSNQDDFWDLVKQADLFIFFLGMTPIIKQKQAALINTINVLMKIPTFPNWETSWHFDDKIAESYILFSHGAYFVPAWIFWNREAALRWAEKASYPVVFKLNGGAGSLNVIKVKDRSHANKLIRLMFGRGIKKGMIPGGKLLSTYKFNVKNILRSETKRALQSMGLKYSVLQDWSRDRAYVYFQEFMPNNTHDTRVTVIFGKAFAFIRENRPNDFRSSGSGVIKYAPELIDLRCVQIAQEISQRFGFQTMAYDFLYDESGAPVINEFSCQFIDRAVYNCPGYWDEDLNWTEGHYWPQYIQLKALLGKEDLKQPEIEPHDTSDSYFYYEKDKH